MSLQKLLISLAHLLLILCHGCTGESRVVSKSGLPASSSATPAACANYPCDALPPPVQPHGYPLYGAPPPPGYPVFWPPPPPPQGNCPPGQVAGCCQYAPPIPYGYSPPYPYGYMPLVNHAAAPAFFPSLLCLIVVVLCFVHN